MTPADEAAGKGPARDWGTWLGWAVVVVTAGSGVMLFDNRRLQRLVRRRTAELNESGKRLRELFDQAPVPMMILSYSELLPEGERLRNAGITDLREYLRAQPEVAIALARKRRVVGANRQALALLDCATAAEIETTLGGWQSTHKPEQRELLAAELAALRDGVDHLQLETAGCTKTGRELAVRISWEVARYDGRRDPDRVQLVWRDITEEQRAGRALGESEARYRQLFAQSPVALMEFDFSPIPRWFAELRAAGVTQLEDYFAAKPPTVETLLSLSPVGEVNEAAIRLLGAATRSDLIATLPQMITPELREIRLRLLLTLWAEQDPPRTGEVSIRRLDGTVRHYRYERHDVPFAAGRPRLQRALTALADITEQKQAELTLRDSETRFRELFELCPIPLLEYDCQSCEVWFAGLREAGVTDLGAWIRGDPVRTAEAWSHAPLVAVNRAALELAGVESLAQWPQEAGWDGSPETGQPGLRVIIAHWSGEGELGGEFRFRRLDGEDRQLRYIWRMPVREGRPHFGRSLAALVDITEQKRTEQELRASDSRYRELFDNAVGGVYRTNAEGQFLSANPAMARLLGYTSPGELLQRSRAGFASTLYVRPGRRDEFFAQLGKGDYVTDFESEIRTRDGSTAWMSENVHVVRDARGRVRYLDGFVTDVTARRRLENEWLRASKLEAVGILAGGIAHDFNNILTVVLGNVTLAEMDVEPSTPLGRMLRDAKQATLRARDLTQQLLTFAKGGEPVRATVALPELLRESADFALHGSKARAVYALPAELWPACVDKGQIGQVVQNLVINAVQAMPQGGTITLQAANVHLAEREVGVLPAGDYVCLTVTDTGVGIASEHLGKIFDPYFTTKQQGSGLGLATVYSIVRKHQGAIEVESRLGEGTRFSLWLPAAPAGAIEVAESTAATIRLHGRVLFMDDEAPIREMAGKFFERLGLDYVLTTEGAETVRLYREALQAREPFDLVIIDLTVPGGMGGREAMQLLRAMHPEVHAIVSSGYSRDPVLANYRAHGFAGILPKPYSLDQLQQTLRSVLGPGYTPTT